MMRWAAMIAAAFMGWSLGGLWAILATLCVVVLAAGGDE